MSLSDSLDDSPTIWTTPGHAAPVPPPCLVARRARRRARQLFSTLSHALRSSLSFALLCGRLLLAHEQPLVLLGLTLNTEAEGVPNMEEE